MWCEFDGLGKCDTQEIGEEAVLHLFIEFKKAYDSFRKEVLCNVLIWYPHETGQANNNVSE